MGKIKQLFGFDETEVERPLSDGPSIFQQIQESFSEGIDFMVDKTVSTLKDTAKETIKVTTEMGKDTFFSAWGTLDFKDKKKPDDKPKNQFGQTNRQTLIQAQIMEEQRRKKSAMNDLARFEVFGMSQIDKNKRLHLNLDYSSEHTDDAYHANLLKEDVIEDLEKQDKQKKAASAQSFQATGGINMHVAIEGGSQKGGPNISSTGGGVG